MLFSLKNEQVNCILAEYGTTAADSLKVIKYLKIPLVVHFHGFDASIKNVLAEYRQKYLDMFTYASKINVVSKKMYADLEKLGCPSEKLVVNCCAPHNSFFKIKSEFNTQQFLSIGRFVKKKAPEHTIKAFKKAVNEFPAAQLIMAGDGPLLEESKNLASSMDLTANISFPGVLNRERIQSLMKKTIAFVQHSVVAENGDSEGTPVAILEAQAAGLPVISTFHAGIPDVVINEETGLLVEENDVDGMAKNMIRLLKEEDLAEQLGNAGRQRAKENFTMDRHLQILEKEIENSMLN